MVTKKEFLEELTQATNDLINKVDTNGDKQLSKDEVRAMYKKCKYPNPTLATNALFELFDDNKDGKLSVDEVKVSLLVEYIIEAETFIKKFVDTFFKADSNKDNKITWDEAKQFFVKGGSSEAKATVFANSMFEDVDSDNDKSITRDELREYSIEYFEIYPSE
ncbi:hypothetical protein ACTFIZ_012720 [Dictyostelium cf. discoideum]